MKTRFAVVDLVAFACSGWALSSVSAAEKNTTGTAEAVFHINPTGCRETFVLVEVAQTEDITQINFIYNVRSTCQDPGDFLFYHAITGNESIPNEDFDIKSNGKKATLKTIIPVFDDEGGTTFQMGIEVTWKTSGKKRPTVASLKVTDPFNSSFITDSIRHSVEASINPDN